MNFIKQSSLDKKTVPVPRFLLAHHKFYHLPNILTLSRFGFSVLIFVCLTICLSFSLTTVPYYLNSTQLNNFDFHYRHWEIYLWIASGVFYLLASCTDFFDGYLARKYQLVSDFGKTFDPFADKILNLICLISFTILGIIPIYFALILLGRDLYTTFLRQKAQKLQLVIAANWYGKIATASFMGCYLLIFFVLPLYSININTLGVGKFNGVVNANVKTNFNGWLIYVLLIPFYLGLISSLLGAFTYSKNYYFHFKKLTNLPK